MAKNKAYICGLGAMTPVGIDAHQTAASLRAGLSRNMESAVYDKHFEPFVLSMLPDDVLPDLETSLKETTGLTSRQTRLLRLAAPAMTQALSGIQSTAKIPLLLGGPEPLPSRGAIISQDFILKLGRQAGIPIDLDSSEVFPQGRAAGLIALGKAVAKIESGAPFVLMGGIDTYLDLYLLGTLDAENRILGSRVMDGFIPGEGAGFLLLGQTPPDNMPPLCILAAAQAFEKGHLYSTEPYRGDGLAETLHALFEKSAEYPKIKTVFAGLNGENFGAKEWGVAALRNANRFEEPLRVEHPSDCLGDTGAALGPLLAILAVIGLQKGYLDGPCLAWCSSDYGVRAAAIIDNA